MAGQNQTLKRRALIILLSSEEQYRVPEIAPMVDLHVDKVRKWVVRFNKDGVKGLQPPRRKPGPRGKFDSEMRLKIIELASTPPRQLGLLRTNWTLDALRDYLLANEIVPEISRESLRQILVQSNVNWQRYRSRSTEASFWLQQWKTGAST
ncbi:MAG: helix-turn-helix domain containing protein [Anaerolineae bacterium]|nr:helix-turn-helix domain containing protein [Anaerolineae bacterium]MCB0204686.1 helix-turn-helix domain containing protein [Anaerolineae bacterium]